MLHCRKSQDPGLWAKVPQRVWIPLPGALAEGSRKPWRYLESGWRGDSPDGARDD